jgi:hypothetical protein
MAVDWDANVLAPCAEVFGEPVTYTPANGSPFPITGVFDEAYHEVVMLDNGPAITSESPVLGIRYAEFPTGHPPRKGDTLLIVSANTIYTVKDVQPDGHGHAKLMLNVKAAAS